MENQEQVTEELSNSFAKVLSSHGYGFQFSVLKKAEELQKDTGKSLFFLEASEFPVNVQSTDTRIDFILKKISGGGKWRNTTFLLAECKRANPALSNWCFVKAPFTHRNRFGDTENLIIENLLRDEESEKIVNFAQQNHRINNSYDIGFEIRKNVKGDTSGERGEAIEKAASQILRGMNGFIQTMTKEQHVWKKSYKILFLPVIFTTANLFVSDVDISSSDLQTGEIKLTKEQIKSVSWLYYQYPMSIGLKHSTNSQNESKDISSLLVNDYLRTIPIVSADGIESFLKTASFDFVEDY